MSEDIKTEEIEEETETEAGPMTPEEWEASVKESIDNYLDALLSISKDCNMATLYSHPVSAQYETHREFDTKKVDGAELRIVFKFVTPIDKSKMNFT